MSFCEVRVPTYKRPDLLRRALSSLISQDHKSWKAIVFDDSPEREGERVVSELKDARISCVANPERLGGAANLDQAFETGGVIGGAWATVLEDDNFLMPSFLRSNLEALDGGGAGILLRNQQVCVQLKDHSFLTDRTTRGEWFAERLYQPLELHARLFLFEGISNGGLFWNTSIGSNLAVGPQVKDSGLQEYCRTLQISEPLLFQAEPLCVWAEMPIELVSRSSLNGRAQSRGLQSIRRWLIQRYGSEVIERARLISAKRSRELQFEVALTDALYTRYDFKFLSKRARLRRLLRSYAKSKLVRDPLNNYWKSFSERSADVPVRSGGAGVPSAFFYPSQRTGRPRSEI
jgi:glycosyltransferase involved in cell wall biosynthesis